MRTTSGRMGEHEGADSRSIEHGDERFRRIVETGPEVVLVVTRDLAIRYRNRDAFGPLPLGAGVRRLSDLLGAPDARRVAALVRRMARKPGMTSTLGVRLRTGNGPWLDAEATFTNLLTDDAVGGIVVHLYDVGRWVALEQQLRQQALLDPLTTLPNRLLFRDRLEHALARSRIATPVALLFIDIDRFKAINDGLGHAAGDQLLVMLAQRLQSVVRAGETVARLGGDEFAVLMEEAGDPADVSRVARRVLAALERPFWLGGADVQVSASVGVAFSRDARRDADELLRNADVAMYEAKGNGGGRWAMFESEMQDALRERLELVATSFEPGQGFQFTQPLGPVDVENVLFARSGHNACPSGGRKATPEPRRPR